MAETSRDIRKIFLLGDTRVGKTSLVNKLINNRFSDQYYPSIGGDFAEKSIQINHQNIPFIIWDMSGHSFFLRIKELYLQRSHGVIIVYDITSRESFDHLTEWIQLAFTILNKDIPLIIIGNKLDLEQERQVEYEDAIKFVKSFNSKIKVIETSAATGEGIEHAFHDLADWIY